MVANSASKAGSTINRKRIILVAQGTEILDHSETVVLTLRGLANQPDTLVIAILCQRGATLGPHLAQFDNPDHRLPANARVVDYFPYDAVLAHADAFVSNSGFGGVLGQEKYKLRAAELSAESKTYNPVKIVEKAVLGEVAT